MCGTSGIGQSRLLGSIFTFPTEKSRHERYQEGKKELRTKPSIGDRASQNISIAVKRGLFGM